MAISDQIQMLVSAFIFGLLFQSTIAVLFLYINGHGSTIFQDSRRLALVLFLTSSALWAQIDFINLAIPSTSPTACQITIIGSTLFDQAARVFIGGFLLWSVAHVKKTQVETLVLSALMGIRAVVGVVFVVFARPQFAPVCVARSDLLPASVIVMVLDIIIIGILTIRVFTLGLFDVIRNVRPSTKQVQSKAHVCCIAAFVLWTLTSSVMMIGMPTIILLLRTALPASGLLVLIWVLTIYTGALLLPLDNDSITPEARSPFVVPTFHSSSSLSNDNGSPARENGFTRTANLFVVNPSNTPHDSSAMMYLEDVKAEDDSYTHYQCAGSRNVNEEDAFPLGTGRISATTLEAVNSAAFLAAPRQAPVPTASKYVQQAKDKSSNTVSATEVGQKRARFGWSKKSADKSVHRIVISNPVMQGAESLTDLPFTKIRTIDLATAAASEQERRDNAKNRQLVAKRPAPPPPVASDAWRKSSSTRRKELPRGAPAPMTSFKAEKVLDISRLSVTLNGSSTSASLSPGREDVRRRSPRSMKAVEGDIETAYFLASRPNTIGAPNRESQETVMYVNDIIYDHPSMVESIIKEAPIAMEVSSKSQQLESMKTSKSIKVPSEPIIHRPRPSRQNSELDQVIFPHLHHKRSKSGPSTETRNLALELPYSNIVDIPATTQRPTTAAGLKKLLPSDTRSMTVDEKISLLFPAPPGAHLINSRRSSVPSLPQIPSIVLLGEASNAMPTEQESQENRASKRSTISFGSQIQNDGITPFTETPIIGEHGIYRFSANTYRNLAESPRNSRLPEIQVESRDDKSFPSKTVQSEASSSQRGSVITSFSSEVDGSHDDSKSAWASIHSPVPAIDVVTQMTARETYIRLRKDASTNSSLARSDFSHAPIPTTLNEGKAAGDGEGLMTAMVGSGDAIQRSENILSFLLNPSPLNTENSTFLPSTINTWHRRIGDELPAFSRRRKDLRSRTMPPPTPLVLGSNRRQPPIIRQSLVSQKDSLPETALKEILAQLHKFDAGSRESLNYSVHHKPQNSCKSPSTLLEDNFGLLENLEKEIGQQETFWMRMQHNFDRDSNSTILTPQLGERTPKALPSPPSDTSSNETARSMSKKLNLQNKGSMPTTDKVNQNSNNPRPNIWQRLAEAQVGLVGNAPGLLGPGNFNFVSISKAQQLSPTPPDSLDSESESVTDMDYDTDEPNYESEFDGVSPTTKKRTALWLPKLSSPTARIGHLWNYTQDISTLRTTSCEPAAKWLRPIQRRDLQPLSIKSLSLWSKPTLHANGVSLGLWGSKAPSPKVIIDRPKTQRPTRKSKRVTFLPAIIENPSPLPYKRDTLGIFQFPWGEKSDSAIYDPIPVLNRASLVPLVFNSNFEPKPIHPDPEYTEYSSSFFDDYEEDYEGGSEANSDDDFDESTLWEIATLLGSQDVPSRSSLFPCPRIIEDYDDEDDSEPESMENNLNSHQATSVSAWPAMVKFIPIQPLKPLPPLPTMQEDDDDYEQTHSLAEKGFPLSAPEWQVFLPALDNAAREESFEISTQESYCSSPEILCDNAGGSDSDLPVKGTVTLWTQPSSDRAKEQSSFPGYGTPPGHSEELLWTAKAWRPISPEHRTTVRIPAAISVVRKSQVNTLPLSTLYTNQLWTLTLQPSSERNWNSTSCVRVQCPSTYSAFTLERSSPSSDDTLIASAVTNASSHTSSILKNIFETNEESAWQELNISSKVSRPLLVESSPANTDAVVTSSKRPVSLRRSKVLASRDLWESRTSTQGTASGRKTWRSSYNSNLAQDTNGASTCDFIVPHAVHLKSNMIPNAAPVDLPATEPQLQLSMKHNAVRISRQLWTPTSPVIDMASDNVTLWSQSLPLKRDTSTWTAPLRSNTASGVQGKSLWSLAEAKERVKEASATPMTAPFRRPSSNKPLTTPAGLDKIESTKLWRPKWSLPESPKDWLTSKRSRKVEFRY